MESMHEKSVPYLDLGTFGRGGLPSIHDTSRIMGEAPEFEPYLPHSRILNFAIMICSQAPIFRAIGTHF